MQNPVDDTYYFGEIVYNGKSYTINNGLTVFIYDKITDRLVECVTISAKSDTVKR